MNEQDQPTLWKEVTKVGQTDKLQTTALFKNWEYAKNQLIIQTNNVINDQKDHRKNTET
jgi:hypothetical protein